MPKVSGLVLALQDFLESNGDMEVMVYVPHGMFRPVLETASGASVIRSSNGDEEVCVLRVPDE
jgi:hypothetical protein